MTALTQDRKTDQIGTPDNGYPTILSFPVAASTSIYGGAMVATNASGYAVPASSSEALIIWGRARKQALNTTAAGYGSAGAINVYVDTGAFYYNGGTGADAIAAANVGQYCYAIDDNTVGLTDGGGTRPVAGVIMPNEGWATTLVGVWLGGGSPYQNVPEVGTGTTSLFKCRAVVTSLSGAYGGSTTGILTASSAAAFGTQDGVATLAVGDVVFLPEGTTNITAASDAGPYVITTLGSVSVKWVLTRPDWWTTGSAIQPGQVIEMGGEGTLFGGTSWKTFVAKSQVVDTNAPLFWPGRVTTSVTLVAGVKALATVPIASATTTQMVATLKSTGGTTATTIMYQPTSVTAGTIGTGTVTWAAMSAPGTNQTSDTSVLRVSIINW